MKNITFRLPLLALLAALLFTCIPTALAETPDGESNATVEGEDTNAAEGEDPDTNTDPAPEITHFNLSFDNDTHLLYRIDFSAIPNFEPNKSNCGVLFWKTQPTDPTVNGGGKLYLPQVDEVEGKTTYIVKYTDLNATQLCDTIWAVPFAVVDEEYRYGETVEYSIVQYAIAMLVGKDTKSDDAAFCTLLRNMLSYGDAAQKYFNYKTDTLPSDVVLKGSVTVTLDWGLYNSDAKVVTVERGVKGAAKGIEIAAQRDCYEQTGWYLGDEKFDFESATLDEDITLTARYKLKDGYTDVLIETRTDGTCSIKGVAGDKTALTKINIPKDAPSGETVVEILQNAFQGCINVTSITLPDDLKWIEEKAFRDCTKVTTVELPASVSDLGGLAFAKSTKITLASGNENFELDENGVLYDAGKNILISYPNDATATSYTLPDTVMEIAAYAFSGNTYLETVIFSSCLENIGNSAFEGCTKLTKVDLSEITYCSIGEAAFRNCTALRSVNFNWVDGDLDIERFAFAGCTVLRGSSLSGTSNIGPLMLSPRCTLHGGAFKDCVWISEILIQDADIWNEGSWNTETEKEEGIEGNFAGWTSTQKLHFRSHDFGQLIERYFYGDDEQSLLMLGSAARVFDRNGNEIKYNTETGVWTEVVDADGKVLETNDA